MSVRHRLWWREVLPLDWVVDPARLNRHERHRRKTAPFDWGYTPVPGTLKTEWFYVDGIPPDGDPLPPAGRYEVLDIDADMPRWARQIMLLITGEVEIK